MSNALKDKAALTAGESLGLGVAAAFMPVAQGTDVAIGCVASATEAEAVIQQLKKTGVHAIAINTDQADMNVGKPSLCGGCL